MKMFALMLTTTVVLAQTGFEVASVKPAGPYREGRPVGRHGGPGTEDPGQIHWQYVSMRKLLTEAYGLKEFQLKAPSWIGNEFFDIDARVPAGADLNQFRLMLQGLLIERFQLKARLETQPGQVYELVVAKNGPKLKPSAAADITARLVSKESIGPDGHPVLHRGPDGIVELPAAMHGKGHLALKTFEGVEIRVQHEGLEYLVGRLEAELERPVVDRTGVTGLFDYTLAYLSRNATAPTPELARPDLFSALQSQLGMKLDVKTLPTEVLVVERVEKVPTEN